MQSRDYDKQYGCSMLSLCRNAKSCGSDRSHARASYLIIRRSPAVAIFGELSKSNQETRPPLLAGNSRLLISCLRGPNSRLLQSSRDSSLYEYETHPPTSSSADSGKLSRLSVQEPAVPTVTVVIC